MVQSVFWYLVTSGDIRLNLGTDIAGVVLRNTMQLIYILPLPTVTVFMVLIFCRAKKLLKRFEEETNGQLTPAYQRMKGDLRLLYAFGIVYILGFGLNFVAMLNSLINLSGYLHVLPDWERNETFCEYKSAFEALANILINFSNSVIVVQSRHVQIALKKMYRVTSRVVRNVSGGDVTENLIQGEEASQEP